LTDSAKLALIANGIFLYHVGANWNKRNECDRGEAGSLLAPSFLRDPHAAVVPVLHQLRYLYRIKIIPDT
jgi:hypothetical protein